MVKEAFILFVKARRPLWCMKDKGYKDLPLKRKLMEDILELLKGEFPIEMLLKLNMDTIKGLKTQWKQLRSTYTTARARKKIKSGAGAKDVHKPWIWVQLMCFLQDPETLTLEQIHTSSLQVAPITEKAIPGVVLASASLNGEVSFLQKFPSLLKLIKNILHLGNCQH